LTITAHLPVSSAWRGIAAVCALMVGLLGIFSSSSQLHGSVHSDADHADHTCVITLFSQGIEDSDGCADLLVSLALFPAGEIAAVTAAPVTDLPDRLPPGRGPPLC